MVKCYFYSNYILLTFNRHYRGGAISALYATGLKHNPHF